MRYHGARLGLALATLSLSMVTFVIAIQPAHAKSDPAVIVLFYPPTDCETHFDTEFWANYDAAMAQEWGISSQTICLDKLSVIEKAELQSDLIDMGLNVLVMSSDDHLMDGINDKARGVAIPAWNTGSVKFNGEYTTTTVSHETLHLILEDMGYPKACYADKMHEHAYEFARYNDNIMIVQHFDC